MSLSWPWLHINTKKVQTVCYWRKAKKQNKKKMERRGKQNKQLRQAFKNIPQYNSFLCLLLFNLIKRNLYKGIVAYLWQKYLQTKRMKMCEWKMALQVATFHSISARKVTVYFHRLYMIQCVIMCYPTSHPLCGWWSRPSNGFKNHKLYEKGIFSNMMLFTTHTRFPLKMKLCKHTSVSKAGWW